MPAGDVIFQRMDVASDAELAAIARALHREKAFAKQESRAERLDMLSRELRKDAGSTFKNWLRNDHDLAYVRILEDVAAKAADAADWPKPRLASQAKIERIENYIVRAFAFAAAQKQTSEDEATRAQKAAEAELEGTPGFSVADKALLIATYLTLVGPTGLALWIASPAMRRVTPAVLALIHIRFRREAEALLGDQP
jgi:hypothetical protein